MRRSCKICAGVGISFKAGVGGGGGAVNTTIGSGSCEVEFGEPIEGFVVELFVDGIVGVGFTAGVGDGETPSVGATVALVFIAGDGVGVGVGVVGVFVVSLCSFDFSTVCECAANVVASTTMTIKIILAGFRFNKMPSLFKTICLP
ncbi:MAG: hypothetical protein NVSMB56_09300 [Pyrinomonadaceae bacterium]